MRILVVLLSFLFLQQARAQIVLNEVCTMNGTVIIDEDSAHSDWVELYNAGSVTVDLEDWQLSDRADELDKWRFPEHQLAPGDYLLVFLSGKDRFGDTLHANFKVGEGEELFLSDDDEVLQDVFNSPAPAADHSWGCATDGNSQRGYFTSPTPGASNNTSLAWPGYVAPPQFNLAPGFYNGNPLFSITTGDNQSVIHYTIDGSVPGATSPVYSAGFNLPNTAVIRAVALKPGLLPSPMVNGTYFINFECSLPVISISTEPALLFDTVTGIYMTGQNADTVFPYYGANWWLDTEIPIHLEYFTRDNQREVDQDMGLQIHGGSMSRTQSMKSLRILARKQYGKASLDYQLISDKPIDSYKKFVLRNSSSDFEHTLFRDGMAQQLLLREKLDIDVLGYEPCVVFINGAYWGIHNIREKIGPHYLEENHGVDPENLDMMKEDTIVEEGDSLDFLALFNYVTTHDLSVDSSYERVSNWLDVESFCDYIIAETYMNNNDWPENNMKYWRVREAGAKWRYILFDLDVSFNGEPWSPVTLDWLGTILGPIGDNTRHTVMLKKMLNENDSFRVYFINRYADLLNTSFTPSTVRSYISNAEQNIAPEMARHKQRWGGSVAQWHTEIDTKVIPFADQRQQIVRDQLEQALLPGQQKELTLEVWPAEAGTVHLNTITPHDYPWTGIYYSETPVTLTAQAEIGFHFSHWEGVESWTQPVKEITITLSITEATLVRAVFVPDHAAENKLLALPNPALKGTNASALFYAETAGPVSWMLINMNGQRVEGETLNTANGWQMISIPTQDLSAGIYFISVVTATSTLTTRLTVVAERP